MVRQPRNKRMGFLKKHREKFQIGAIILLLLVCFAIGTPIVVKNIKESQIQAIKLESKADAKEAWQKEFDKGNIEEGEIFEWTDGQYCWVVDSTGNVMEK